MIFQEKMEDGRTIRIEVIGDVNPVEQEFLKGLKSLAAMTIDGSNIMVIGAIAEQITMSLRQLRNKWRGW